MSQGRLFVYIALTSQFDALHVYIPQTLIIPKATLSMSFTSQASVCKYSIYPLHKVGAL